MTTPTLTALAAAVQSATVDRWRDVQPGIAEVLADWAETRLEDGALMLSAEVRGQDPEQALHRFAERQALYMANRTHVAGDLLPALDVSVPGREACVWRVGGVWVELWRRERPEPALASPEPVQGPPVVVPRGLLGGRLPFARNSRKQTTQS